MLIKPDKRTEQRIKFIKLTDSLSDLVFELGGSFDKFIYIWLLALQLRIDELLHQVFKHTILIVVRSFGH
jgi:hypothetical protein